MNILESVNFSSTVTDLCHIMNKYGSDKGNGWHNYTKLYFSLFQTFRNTSVSLFEITTIEEESNMIHCCENNSSLKGWKEWFGNHATINKEFPYDIIIDDCGMNYEKKISNMQIYWKFLKNGGLYIIEDILTTNIFQLYIDLLPLRDKLQFQHCKVLEIPNENNTHDNNLLILLKQSEHFE